MGVALGIAGNRNRNPTGIVYHNDAGYQNMNGDYWLEQLTNATKERYERGFAHAYAGDSGIRIVEEDQNIAWHCGNSYYNTNFLSIEACQSYGDKYIFMQNEEKCFKWMADKCRKYNITPDSTTIKMHFELFATACPHRSVEIHGGYVLCKQYVIEKVKSYMQEIGGDIMVWSTFKITDKDKDKVYFDNGVGITPLNHPDELKKIKADFKNATGRELPHYDYTTSAPWYRRKLEVYNRPYVKTL